MRLFRVFLLSLIVAAPLLAQPDHMAAHDEKPITLEPGLGHFHWPVSTKNAEAQRFFDQGMKYLYGFNHESAVASFQRTVSESSVAATAMGPGFTAETSGTMRAPNTQDAADNKRMALIVAFISLPNKVREN